ncbi:hypothetical protein LSTR_LSTR008884 [Laodelphax striatellus]|uniref:RPA-interacting protein C-terminal domain-containing protein n=1 Tax=Laodelphax striatellus TaxID=195883 RepID=A0A482WLC3_LAOST|nr:hypothetical protein LSTR_LSTR008884 [Laodelphax striatellus]
MMDTLLTSPKANNQKRLEMFKKKFGSPDFKDVLRKRCRDKIKADRGALFNASRLISNSEVLTIMEEMTLEPETKSKTEIEIHSLEAMDVAPQTNISDSLDFDEEEGLEKAYIDDLTEKYFTAMYSKLMAEEMELFDSWLDDKIICPLCQRGVFECSKGLLTCGLCAAQLPWTGSPTRLKDSLNLAVAEHSAVCRSPPCFSIVTYEGTTTELFMNCSSCYHLAQIS